ncbi:alpha/beta hydrolase family protein [Nocardia sp. NPDC051321]|uniref:alpha/beta hydrolase family protein n=1 Tax=Nocardia sp. NPDC051321 TaxID=3364323 RepID=UPI0037921AEF
MRTFVAALLLLLLGTVVTAPARADTEVLHYDTRIAADAATVWYPASAAHRLPVALVLPGANVRREYYAGFATELVRYGFVVVVPTHYPLFFADYNVPSEQSLNDVVTWARAQARGQDSPVRSVVDPENLVVAGHSYGGATALYAAANRCQPPFCLGLAYRRPAELRAIVGHGTNSTFLGNVDAVTVDAVPTMLVNGSDDGVSDLAEAHETFTKLTGSPVTAFVDVLGANHFGLADEDNPPGAVPDAHEAVLSRQRSVAIAARWTAMWFRANLGDEAAMNYLRHGADEPDSGVTVQIR